MPGRPAPSLRGRALQWLAQRDHSRQELRGKLLRWLADQARQRQVAATGHQEPMPRPSAAGQVAPPEPEQGRAEQPPAAAVDSLLDELHAAGHLSDERFAESRIHARAARFGNQRITRELRQLGAPPSEEALAALKSTEVERATAVWQRKFGAVPATPAERARQIRFLAARGFSAATVRRVVSGAEDEDFSAD